MAVDIERFERFSQLLHNGEWIGLDGPANNNCKDTKAQLNYEARLPGYEPGLFPGSGLPKQGYAGYGPGYGSDHIYAWAPKGGRLVSFNQNGFGRWAAVYRG